MHEDYIYVVLEILYIYHNYIHMSYDVDMHWD
jgi:hypothetical protein